MYKYITEAERYQIEILLQQHYSIRQIADVLGHKYQTIWYEVKKGTVKQLDTHLAEHYVYKADYAHMVSVRNKSNRGRNLKIGSDYELVEYIEDMVKNKKYSPAALLAHARNEGLHFATSICEKTIYNYFDMGLFLNVSYENLPYKKQKRKKKETESKVSLNNRSGRSIEKRMQDVKERKIYGHWEMDTVVGGQGKGKSCLLVLSERMTREEIIVKLKDKKAASVVHALNMMERRLGSKAFREKFKTITCDNGVEFLNGEGIEKSRYTKGNRTMLYYCHPYSSWERGTNENINRMIRRFFPKGINFDEVTKRQVQLVEDWINDYPRKILGGLSSNQYRARLIQ
ncbi:MAG: IS30 family transposase [Lachnospiraceae bacterium]|nr:IS30 family transposase [Lachnospiraceae bacterium]